MHLIDWLILLVFISSISYMAWRTKRYARSVADFLAANRCAGRYIIAVGDGMAGFGPITMVAYFQMFYEGGFTPLWWQSILMPMSVFMAITGWVIFRFRQTRAMTLAQFFEMRYSRRFRVVSGILAFLSGIINFGIFPAVSMRFIMYFCGLPVSFGLFGIECSTYAVGMALLLALAIWFTFVGGQISVMVTDFLQGAFCNIAFIIVLVFLFYRFDWSTIITTISQAPAGKSMVHPFKIGGLENYDTFYFLIGLFSMWYGAFAWQGQAGYNSAARDAHEARMSKILGYLRMLIPTLFLVMLPLCVYTVMHNPLFTGEAQTIQGALNGIADEQIRSQMTVPIALSNIFPVGIMGLFITVVMAAFVGTHDTYLHSWGSIFLQDIVLPLRGKPFTPRQHLRYLRLSILGVAVFIYVFSLIFNQRSDIFMFFSLSGAIFLGGAGAVIVGGLYWKKALPLAHGRPCSLAWWSRFSVLPSIKPGRKWPLISNPINRGCGRTHNKSSLHSMSISSS